MKSTGRQKSATSSSNNNDQLVAPASQAADGVVAFAKKSTAKKITSASSQDFEPLRAKSARQPQPSVQGTPTVIRNAKSARTGPAPGAPSNSQRSVQFSQPASPDVTAHRGRTPALKVAATPHLEGTSRRLSVITPTVIPLTGLPRKSNAHNAPFWQTADEAWNKKRGQDDTFHGTIGRPIKHTRRVRGVAHSRPSTVNRSQTISLRSLSKTPQAVLGRRFKLKNEGDPSSESDSDSPMDEDEGEDESARTASPRILGLQQVGLKAARKREWPPRQFSSSPSSTSPSGSESEELLDGADADDKEYPSLFSDEAEEEEEEEPPSDGEDSDIQIIHHRPRRSLSPPEIKFLASPPRTVKILAESPPPEFLHPQPSTVDEVSRDLIEAVKPVTLPLVRMRQTRRIPFLLRNLRRGFISRCNELDIPTESSTDSTPIHIHYEFPAPDGEVKVYRAVIDSWACPLCDFHGIFKTKEMLLQHLSWDHPEGARAWDMPEDGRQALRIILTECIIDDEGPFIPPDNIEETLERQPSARASSPAPQPVQPSASPLPFVALSPPTSKHSIARDDVQERGSTTPTPIPQSPLATTALKYLREESPTPAPSLSRTLTSRSRSITAGTTTTTTTTTMATTGTRTTSTRTPSTAPTSIATPVPRSPSRYPTPPPAHNRLGPAAQPPYLPFKSEYGGPDIYYSCRPGGACIYDLLNTLPLEPYGVLAWDILDREDEIFDSDNVKDEYKVMHALWGRWIVLNRNVFIADYYKGTVAFVDFYWKMIHRAAGWDGLRYWLLMLSANRFISGHEIAKILKYYEELVGMEYWD